MNNLDRIFETSAAPQDFARGYRDYLIQILTQLNTSEVESLIQEILSVRARRGTIYLIGNGGSAATSSHFANDLTAGMRLKPQENPIKAVSLCDNSALITALANDDGYDQIFTRQLENLLKSEDLIIAISASGNSPNVVKGVEYARALKVPVVSLIGFDGGVLKNISTSCVHVPSLKGEYGPVEDLHMVLDHLVSAYLYRFIRTSFF